MKTIKISSGILLLMLYLLQVSCSSDPIETLPPSVRHTSAEIEIEEMSLSSAYFKTATEASIAKTTTCEMTAFQEVLKKNFEMLIQDPTFDLQLAFYLRDLHHKYVTHYIGPNYYGIDGQFNQLAKKRLRELKKFWELDRQIYLNGQHTATLQDFRYLADMIESFDRSVRNAKEAEMKARHILNYSESSEQIPENHFFALEAFTSSNGLMVISDGILELLEQSGVPGEIAFSGLLAHEWWHQAQFEFQHVWEGDYFESRNPELLKELEADFAAAYFLVHKKGATYNWKRIDSFFEMSFNSGDCLIDSPGHHGTPAQRLQAARNGAELAESEKSKGKPQSAAAIHKAFLESL
ncbi:hypothetical protein [Christiangramia portivictoriae]|uniref:hypothetical protein n=1 Tax=Christiangramia portivictoriae TaxID=326069 RepID=UPI00041C9386|nr:hypothetical protein [Christiangramia portivictoriae]